MRRIFYFSILLVLILLALSFASAFGCVPDENDGRRCSMPIRRAHREPVILATGESPDKAMEPTGEWKYIAPNTSVWYKMDDARVQLNVWLDAGGVKDVTLAIYAPDQTDLYGKPVGRGSYNKLIPEHDLFWTGRTRAYGTWYALVANYSNIAVPYRIGYERSRNRVADQCAVCHGYIIVFEDCQPADSPHCTNLRDNYGQ